MDRSTTNQISGVSIIASHPAGGDPLSLFGPWLVGLLKTRTGFRWLVFVTGKAMV